MRLPIVGRTTALVSFIGLVALFALYAVPLHAYAATGATVQTAQLLPLGANTCQQPVVQDVTPYIYSGELDSFDVTISDASYVAILGSVGDTAVPLNQMTRWQGPNGALRVHVDIQGMPIHGSMPVSLTLLSAATGRPVCASVITFAVLGTTDTGTYQSQSSAPTQQVVTATQSPVPSENEVGGLSAGATSSGESTATSAAVSGSLVKIFERSCPVANTANQLWFVLLAIYVVIAAFTVLSNPPLAEGSATLSVALILIPLILLAGFWYFVPICRATNWIPVILLFIAAVALLTAFRHRSSVAKIISLPPARF